MEIVFSHPNYLWFLLSIPVLVATHLLSIKYTTKKGLKFANFPAIEKATGEKITSYNLNILITRAAILTLTIFSVAGSTLWYTTLTTTSDYALAIDASSSMLADDYTPNRLEAAKLAAELFIDQLPSATQVAVVSFAGTSFVDMQPSDDSGKIKQAIRDIEAKTVGGTDIGEAIITATNLLSISNNPKVIILLTDGRTNVGGNIEQAILYANTNQVTVNTIGIGTITGGNIAEDITLTLDEQTLQNIASGTSGKYILAQNNDELISAYEELLDLSNRKVSFNLSILFLVISIILLLVEWSLINTKYKILP